MARAVRRSDASILKDAHGADSPRSQPNAACKSKRCAPPPPETCSTDCEAAASELGDECASDGETDDDTCDSLEQGSLDDCMDSCGAAPDATCAEDCEESVQQRFASLTGGRGGPRAKLKARKAFRRCMKSARARTRSLVIGGRGPSCSLPFRRFTPRPTSSTSGACFMSR